MDLYVIRRPSAWADLKELKAAGEVSARIGNEMADQVRWIRSYVVREPDGLTIGKIRLADGSTVLGVLGEPALCEGQKEITAFGGWRAYIAAGGRLAVGGG